MSGAGLTPLVEAVGLEKVYEDGPARVRVLSGLDLVLDAGPGGHVPSTVLAILENGQIEVLREGAGPIDTVFTPQGSRPPMPPAEV